jgi:DNA anti-recombination protein RmuC
MKKKIAEYVTPDLTEIYKKMEVLDANTSKMAEYSNSIKIDLKQDLRRVESVVDNIERSSRTSQRDTDNAVKEIRREADVAMKEIRRYSDTTIKELNQEMTRSQKETITEIRTLRKEVDDKIKKALDNPLAK